MSRQPDHGVRELGAVRLALRGDLTFTPQETNGQWHYVVEDSLNSRFFRLGVDEYTFVSLLDGRTTVHEALSLLSTVLPRHRLTEADAAGLCRWLVDMELAHTVEPACVERRSRAGGDGPRRGHRAGFNPLMFRVPLFGSPDRVLAALNAWLGWLFSPPAIALALLLVVVGAYRVFSAWEPFAASSHVIFAAGNWPWLMACWLVLKVVHEAGHGIACKHYGGTVHKTGVLFLLCAPLAYVDVTSSWRFRSRRQRVVVSAAGMYVEVIIAAVAAVAWSVTDNGWLHHLCFNAVVMAGFTTLVFNANPLMRFDGYHMLSDALAMPNLYTNGQLYVRLLARRCLMGMPAALPAWPRGRGVFIRVYGLTAFAWRIVVSVSLTVAAVTLFRGAGVVLAAIAAVAWFGLPTYQFVKYFVVGAPGERPRRLRLLLTAGSLAAVGVGLLGYVPWPGASAAPAVVEYSPHTVVRARVAGFVTDVRVADGQVVRAGETLVVLENRELTRELADLELQIRQSEIRIRQFEQKGEFAAHQAEKEQQQALHSQLAEKREQVERLMVRSPLAGKVVRRDLTALAGVYLEEGDEIATIGDESRKEVRLAVSQNALAAFTRRQGQLVRIELPRLPTLHSRLLTVLPRAASQPIHPALAAVNGGPLPVTREEPREGEPAEQPYELLAPHFTGIVELNEESSRTLHAGQRATVTFRSRDAAIGTHLYRCFTRWVRERLATPSGNRAW